MVLGKNQNEKLLRFLLVFLPLPLIFFLLYNPFVDIESRNIIEYDTNKLDNVTFTVVKQTEGFVELVSALVPMPEKLNRNTVCFYNKNTSIIFGNGKVDLNLNVTVNFNQGEKVVQVPHNTKHCITFVGDKYTYNWGFSYTFERVQDFLLPDQVLFEEESERNSKTYGLFDDRTFGINRLLAKISPSTDSKTKREVGSSILRTIIVWAAWCGLVLFAYRIKEFIQTGK